MNGDTIAAKVLVEDEGSDKLTFDALPDGEVYLGVVRYRNGDHHQQGVLLHPDQRRLVAAKLLEGLDPEPSEAPLPIDHSDPIVQVSEQQLVRLAIVERLMPLVTEHYPNTDELVEIAEYIEGEQ